MYKTRLQELCQRKLWRPPEYTTTRDGPDHNPRFRATVTVGGITFDSPAAATSSKEAQGQAAAAALQHFASEANPVSQHPSATVSSVPVPANQIPYKTQLQILMQERNLDPPVYECLREGPPHALRFKATVKVNGQTFEGPQFFRTLREAEHSAANVALMSLPKEEHKEEEFGLYKSILQELAQKEGFSLPKYTTVMDGASHMPMFSSTVEIEGETFSGVIARTKKQAEMHAAKVALNTLNERRQSRLAGGFPLNFKVEEVPLPTHRSTPPKVAMNFPEPRPASVSKAWIQLEKGIGEIGADDDQEDGPSHVMSEKYNFITVGSKETILVNQESYSENKTANNSNLSATPLPKPDIVRRPEKEDSTEMEISLSKDGTSSASSSSDCLDRSIELAEFPIERNGCSLLCNKVRVYPRKPNLVLPDGCTVLPFSDDMWVAVSLDFSNQGGGDAGGVSV